MHRRTFHLQAQLIIAFIGLIVVSLVRSQQESGAFSCSGFGEDDNLIYDENCYLMFDDIVTRPSAITACTAVGGYLAVITAVEENTAVTAILTGTGWINGTNVTGAAGTQSGTWTWSTGEDTTYEAWASTEPDDGDGAEDDDEDCIAMSVDGDWYDVDCAEDTTIVSYLCECDGACNSVCGNSTIDTGEICDDGNATAGDGCSATCAVESGWICDTEEPSVCQLCGNGVIEGTEVCDDDNANNLDGCNSTCSAVETGWECSGEPSDCTYDCSDGVLAVGGEECDDTNVDSGDGCSATCTKECGDESIDTDGTDAEGYIETCDDGDASGGDGCSEVCRIEPGFGCAGEPSSCANNTGGNTMKYTPATASYERTDVRSTPKPITQSKAFEEYKELFAADLNPTVVELILSRVDWPVCGGRSRRAPVFPSKVLANAERGNVMTRIAQKLCLSPSNTPVPYKDFDPRKPYARAVRALWQTNLHLGAFDENGMIQENLRPHDTITFLELTSLITQLRKRGYIDWVSVEDGGLPK